jgi:hypothetical protein
MRAEEWVLFSAALAVAFWVSQPAYARSSILASLSYKGSDYKVSADLYYDPASRRPDLWVDYESVENNEKVSFKATSIQARLSDADIKLAPMPVARVEGLTNIIYEGWDLKTGYYALDRGMALLFHYPVSSLPHESVEFFAKQFPKSIVRDASGKPLVVKVVLCRVTFLSSYPIAAFDLEPAL